MPGAAMHKRNTPKAEQPGPDELLARLARQLNIRRACQAAMPPAIEQLAQQVLTHAHRLEAAGETQAVGDLVSYTRPAMQLMFEFHQQPYSHHQALIRTEADLASTETQRGLDE